MDKKKGIYLGMSRTVMLFLKKLPSASLFVSVIRQLC